MDEVRAGFEDELRRLGCDTLEIGMIHYVDSLADWDEIAGGDVLKYAESLKKQGIIRAVGLSSHNPEAALAAVRSGAVDVLMFSVNPCYDLQPGNENIELLRADESYENLCLIWTRRGRNYMRPVREKRVGITVYESFSAAEICSMRLFLLPALRFLLISASAMPHRPAVASVLAGAHTLKN